MDPPPLYQDPQLIAEAQTWIIRYQQYFNFAPDLRIMMALIKETQRERQNSSRFWVGTEVRRAAKANNLINIKYLLAIAKNPLYLDDSSEDIGWGLVDAAETGKLEIVTCFLEAVLRFTDSRKVELYIGNALKYATENNHLQVVELLLIKGGHKIPANFRLALVDRNPNNFVIGTVYLRRNGSYLVSDNNKTIHHDNLNNVTSIDMGYFNIYRQLPIEIKDGMRFLVSQELSHRQHISLLWKERALFFAAKKGNLPMVKLFLWYAGAEFSRAALEDAHAAATIIGHIEMIKLLGTYLLS